MLTSALVIVLAGAAPLQAQKPQRATPTLLGTPGAAAQPPSATQPATGRPTAGKPARPTPTLGTPPSAAGQPATTAAPTTTAAPAVQPQGVGSGAPAAVAATTAGLAIEPFDEEVGELGAYARRFALQLDSTIATMVNLFRNTSGQPLTGAMEPRALSSRERDRWNRCRDLHWDLQSYASAAHDLPEAFDEAPALQRAAAALDTSLTAFQATGECDNVASMIAAPDRWAPWGQQYESGARRFYSEWYPQARDVQEKNRAFIVALNATGATGEGIPVPPAMPRNPPYAGASVR